MHDAFMCFQQIALRHKQQGEHEEDEDVKGRRRGTKRRENGEREKRAKKINRG